MGSTVVVWHEDGEPWMYGTVVGHAFDNDHQRSYRIRVSKMGLKIIKTNRHIKSTPLIVEE